jgi:hypothetical protein
MITQLNPTTPNVQFFYWTFVPRKQQFQRDTIPEEITSPEFDHTKKIITSDWRYDNCHYGLSTYKYINGKITLIEESESEYDPYHPEKVTSTLKKLVNGEMKLIERNTKIDKESE